MPTYWTVVKEWRLYPKNMSSDDINAVCDELNDILHRAKDQEKTSGVVTYQSMMWPDAESQIEVTYRRVWYSQLQNMTDFTTLRDEVYTEIENMRNRNVKYALLRVEVS